MDDQPITPADVRQLIDDITTRALMSDSTERGLTSVALTSGLHVQTMIDNASVDAVPEPAGHTRRLKDAVVRLSGFALGRQRAFNQATIGVIDQLILEVDRLRDEIGILQTQLESLTRDPQNAAVAPRSARSTARAHLRIAVVKPDWKIRGGFEAVVDRLVEHVKASGHRPEVLSFDATRHEHPVFGRPITPDERRAAPMFYDYMSQVEATRNVRVGRADLVISTQPPSFVAVHPRHLSIFYHHNRPFYELSPYFVRGGFVDAEMHAVATESIRRIDEQALARVKYILAGSETVAERLRTFSARTSNLGVFHAGTGLIDAESEPGRRGGSHVLCVSRHDFPKRTELFVHAAHLAADLDFVSVGSGGLLGYIQSLDRRFSVDGAPDSIDDTDLWLAHHPHVTPATEGSPRSKVRVLGSVSDEALRALYRDAICVVAPALLEDYGLTALEAMSHGKPMVVCDDGGHLCTLVIDGVNGLVVKPTGRAIADAVQRLAADPQLRADLGAAAEEMAAQFSWQRALAEFDEGIERTLA